MSFKLLMLIVVLSTSLGGCSVVKEYPRCYLFRAPEASDILRTDRDTDALINGAFGVRAMGKGKDVVLVDATPLIHKQLSTVWSSVGCVNLRRQQPATGEIIDKWIVARCQEYIDELVRPERAGSGVSRTDVAGEFDEFTCH